MPAACMQALVDSGGRAGPLQSTYCEEKNFRLKTNNKLYSTGGEAPSPPINISRTEQIAPPICMQCQLEEEFTLVNAKLENDELNPAYVETFTR
jgi:hypothetical protein